MLALSCWLPLGAVPECSWQEYEDWSSACTTRRISPPHPAETRKSGASAGDTYLVLHRYRICRHGWPVDGCPPVMNPSSTPCQPTLSAVDSDARIDVVGAARLAAQPPTPSYLWSDEAPRRHRCDAQRKVPTVAPWWGGLRQQLIFSPRRRARLEDLAAGAARSSTEDDRGRFACLTSL